MQAVLLALCFCVLTRFHLLKPKAKPQQSFSLAFQPHLGLMLQAVGLINNKDEWRRNQPSSSAHSSPDAEAERNGFACTTLNVATDLMDQTIFWSPWAKFTEDYITSFPIGSLWQQEYAAPTFCLQWAEWRPNDIRLCFGLTVKKAWWLHRKCSLPLETQIVERPVTRYGWEANGVYIDLFFGILPIYELTRRQRDPFSYCRPKYYLHKDMELVRSLEGEGWKRNLELSCYEHSFMRLWT